MKTHKCVSVFPESVLSYPGIGFLKGTMEKAVNYQGLNGEDHRFAQVDMTNLKALPQRGAVVVITKQEPEPVYIADATSVRDLFMRTDIWRRAQREFGAAGVYVSASGNSEWCVSAARNLRERYNPKMNR